MEEKTRSTAWRVKRAANERKRARNASLRSLQAGSVPEEQGPSSSHDKDEPNGISMEVSSGLLEVNSGFDETKRTCLTPNLSGGPPSPDHTTEQPATSGNPKGCKSEKLPGNGLLTNENDDRTDTFNAENKIKVPRLDESHGPYDSLYDTDISQSQSTRNRNHEEPHCQLLSEDCDWNLSDEETSTPSEGTSDISFTLSDCKEHTPHQEHTPLHDKENIVEVDLSTCNADECGRMTSSLSEEEYQSPSHLSTHGMRASTESRSSSMDDFCDEQIGTIRCNLDLEPLAAGEESDAEDSDNSAQYEDGSDVGDVGVNSSSDSEAGDDTDAENSQDSDLDNSDEDDIDNVPPEQPPNAYQPYPPHPPDPDDADEPDDPDDPDDPNDGNPEHEDENVENPLFGNENLANFHLDNVQLNGLCRILQQCTRREAVALVLSIAVKNCLSYLTVIDMMILLNVILGRNVFPTNPISLWSLLGKTNHGVVKYAYCRRCLRDLGLHDNLPEIVVCGCGYRSTKSLTRVFAVLSYRKQLQVFMSNPPRRNLLQHRNVRVKLIPNNVEDIFDGEGYIRLRQPGGVLNNENNHSYNINADGFKTAKKGRTQAWPIYARLDGLPLNLRQKHMFLVGLWIDDKKPNMNLFMDRFVDQANDLSANGVTWLREDGVEVTSRFFPTFCVVDAMARCEILNQKSPAGYFSCNFCTHSGEWVNGMKFALLPPIPRPLPERRTHDDIVECMLEERRGFKGPAAIMNLDHFDLGIGFPTDDLHPIFLGATVFHLSLFMTHVGEDYYIGDKPTMALINARLRAIRTPSFISRKPSDIQRYKSWQGTEARNFLLYYMVPCLTGVVRDNAQEYIDHFALLSQAVFLLSRQTVSPEDVNEAERCIDTYVERFQEYFGVENMRFNIHMLKHVIECFRLWGPPFVQTTFNYESWNHHLMKNITSPKGSIDQVVHRFLMSFFVASILDREDVSDRVKRKIESLLNASLMNGVHVGNVVLLGKSISRPPTAEERVLLQERGYDCQRVTQFKRAQVDRRGVEYRSRHYRYNGELTRSDDSYIYTWNDEFCVIDYIMMVEHEGQRLVFLTVNVLHTLNPINPSATYIVDIDVDVQNPLVLMTFDEIRVHAIRIDTPTHSCVMPVTNICELD